MILLAFLSVIFLSILFVWGVRKYAHTVGLMDVPNDRSTHCSIVPRGAGVGFMLAVFLSFPLFHFSLFLSYGWTMLAIFLVFVVGLLDDHHDAAPKTKFAVIIVATFLLYLNDIKIDDLGIFFGFHLSLGWLAFPFTVFAVVGFTNALNLVDGLDGLAATISIVILTLFAIVGYEHHDMLLFALSISVIGALLGFLVFNWYPASIFMGDSGSLSLGFIIALLAVKSLAYLPTIAVLFIVAVPVFDTLVVMIRRKRNGKSVLMADQCHFHHVLRHFFAENTPKTVVFIGLMQGIYALTGFQIDSHADEGYLLILFLLNALLLYFFLSAMIKRQKRKC